MIKITIQNILEDYDKYFIEKYFKEEKKVNNFMFENYSKQITDFNSLIHNYDFEKSTLFFANLYFDQFLNVIKKNNISYDIKYIY